MKERWLALSARFAALKDREKQIIAAATVLVIVMGGYMLWVEPAQIRAAALQKQIASAKAELQGVEAQVTVLRAQVKDPDAPNKAAMAEVNNQLAAAKQELHSYDKILVPSERMPQLLQALFARHRGVELVSLRTLPPTPLLGRAAATPAAGKPDAKPAPPVARDSNIHKHGIEIKMAGSYADLLAYVAELEQLPQKLLWGNMSLTVVAHPRCEMTLTVYTLSLDSIWLVV